VPDLYGKATTVLRTGRILTLKEQLFRSLLTVSQMK
jgi:hypothetical protein